MTLRQALKFLVAGFLTVVILALAHLGNWQTAYSSRMASLSAAADATVQLVDSSISEALSTIDLIRARGQSTCFPLARRALDEAVFRSTLLKDVLTSSRGATCSASGYSTVLMGTFLTSRSGVSRDGSDVALHVVSTDGFRGIAVERLVPPSEDVVLALLNTSKHATVGFNTQMDSRIAVAIQTDDGRYIAETPGFQTASDVAGMMSVTTPSAAYPFRVVVRLPRAVLSQPIGGYPTWLIALVAILALAASWLLTTRIFLPDRPADLIRAAIESGEIRPYFQPIFDMHSGNIDSFEVLSRWVKPDGQIIGPSEFIAEVERFSLSQVLLRSLVRETGERMGRLLKHNPGLRFAFNIAPDAFIDEMFVNNLIDAISAGGLHGRNITVEVTERQETTDMKRARQAVQELQRHDIVVAIDDVGTGHNGLSMITSLVPTAIKIDKYFVDGIPDNQRAWSMLNMLVKTAKSLGMKTVAEGVENHDQVEALMQLGVDCAQGYHMAKALPADAAISLYISHSERVHAVVADESACFAYGARQTGRADSARASCSLIAA